MARVRENRRSAVNWVAPIGKPHPVTELIGLASVPHQYQYQCLSTAPVPVSHQNQYQHQYQHQYRTSTSISALYRGKCVRWPCLIGVSLQNHNLWLKTNSPWLQEEFYTSVYVSKVAAVYLVYLDYSQGNA